MSFSTMVHVQEKIQVRIITQLEKIYNSGLLKTVIVNPKFYQNSLVKVRTAKIIQSSTKQ
jgi:hypothetical protein